MGKFKTFVFIGTLIETFASIKSFRKFQVINHKKFTLKLLHIQFLQLAADRPHERVLDGVNNNVLEEVGEAVDAELEGVVEAAGAPLNAASVCPDRCLGPRCAAFARGSAAAPVVRAVSGCHTLNRRRPLRSRKPKALTFQWYLE